MQYLPQKYNLYFLTHRMFKMEDFDTKELKISKGGNQNPQIEGQTTEEKGQKKKQITIYKYTHKTKD